MDGRRKRDGLVRIVVRKGSAADPGVVAADMQIVDILDKVIHKKKELISS